MLQDIPDFAERKRLLESLKNKLEALLSTKLVAAFNGHLLGKAFIMIFIMVFIMMFIMMCNVYISELSAIVYPLGYVSSVTWDNLFD